MVSPAALLSRARERRPALDHLVRAYERYAADAGDRLAAAVTFYWFLSLFPILLLAVSLLGHVYGDQAYARVNGALAGVLPPPVVDTIASTLSQTKGPAGVLGLAGTLLSGLGWIDGLREALRSVWHQNVVAGNLITRRLADVVVLVGLFATIATSVTVTGLATGFSATALEVLGVDETPVAVLALRLAAYAAAVLADTLLFVYLFTRLSRVSSPLRRVVQGAVLGAVGFEVLKVAGAFYVERTTSRGAATYGTFAVVVGLLLFLNLVSRLLLLTAAWVVTGPYDSDRAPSGTSSPDMARRAGIPEEYAGLGRGDPPGLRPGGSPSPLQAAVLGKVPPQVIARRPDDERVPVTAAPPPAGVQVAERAAYLGLGAVAALTAVAGVHAVRTLLGVLRR